MIKSILTVSLGLIGLSALLWANDSAAGLDAGGLYFKDLKGVSMEKEILTLSEKKVQVYYEFKNHTDRDITTYVAFPIEHVAGENYPSDITYRTDTNNPMEFTLHVNKVPRAYQLTITPEKSDLYEDGALVTYTYYWEQTFPKGATTIIEHSYVPKYPAGVTEMISYSSKELWLHAYGEKLEKDYCASKKQIDFFAPDVRRVSQLHYIVQTAKSWDGPIRYFELRLQKEDARALFLCTDIPLRKDSETNTFIGSIENYVPQSDIDVAFLGKSSLLKNE